MLDLKPLLGYIVDQVSEQGGSVGRTALTKLVYLVDVEHCRQYGKQATGIKWRFHHYGPFAADLDADVRSLGVDIDEDVFSGKVGDSSVSGYRYRKTGDWREIANMFNSRYDASVKRCVDKVVEQWALDPLATILDYVYFETEPMQNAKRGEYLDFSKIQIELPIAPKTVKLQFPDDYVRDMRRRLEERREIRKKAQQGDRKVTEPRYDEVYFEACKVMEEEERPLRFQPGTEVKGPDEE